MRASVPVALLLAALPARAQECAATAGGFRPAMTHRAPGAAAAAGISVATLQAWSPPAEADDDRVRARDAAIDAREGRAATLEGDVWRVQVGDDGCALTLELSATQAGRDSPHVLAVIPAGDGYAAARAAVRAALGAGRVRRRGRDLATPVHVRLTGYVFWNGARWCDENPGRGCGHRADVVASLWELRPVWRAEVSAAAPEPEVTGDEGGEEVASGGRHRRHRHHHRAGAD